MLPSHLGGSSKRYKSETDYFVNWLAQTAVGCGFKSSTTSQLPMPTHQSVKGPRLKGKARKLARAEAAATHPQKFAKETKRLTTSELMESAKSIVKRKSFKLLVPCTVYNSHLKAIELRVECPNWFCGQDQASDDGDLELNNIAHAFFNNTLISIRDMLAPFVESSPNPQAPLRNCP